MIVFQFVGVFIAGIAQAFQVVSNSKVLWKIEILGMALNIFLFVGVFVAGITHVLQLVTTLVSYTYKI